MSSTTIKQKLFLGCLGISLSLILLETFLRLGGVVFNLKQDQGNLIHDVANKNEFRILCIGESTTALGGRNAYPFQLEDILNGEGLDVHFEVINKGLVALTSAEILKDLPANLARYKPDVVVVMMGINDPKVSDGEQARNGLEHFLHDLRVYKLFHLLKEHLVTKMKGSANDAGRISNPISADVFDKTGDAPLKSLGEEEPERIEHVQKTWLTLQLLKKKLQRSLSAERSDNAKKNIQEKLSSIEEQNQYLSLYLGDYEREKKDYEKAKMYLERAFMTDFPATVNYIEMGKVLEEEGNCQRAVVFLRKALERNPGSENARMSLARCFEKLGVERKTLEIYAVMAQSRLRNSSFYSEIGVWLLNHHLYPLAEAAFKNSIYYYNGKEAFLYEQLAQIYEAQGKNKEAEEARTKAESLKSRWDIYPPMMVENYNKLADIVLTKGIKLIAMQYPLRSVEPLKEMLKNRDKIFFIENKENFSEGLKAGHYAEYFSDNFADDFGHCTRSGNRMIAQNVSRVILNIEELTKHRPWL